ncbi:SusC/RagA family TonB-linked outer membrane protein [Spirosoma panaciterrae]|uniref:SusC/RagA family TonB-linked outer membrane protein n=1 Tax=Spirosoma panaciterrae TaxID=496058 RepID=UPI0003707BE8|nr:TonB-dependent receptor [Spirosoma panaciterrae]
MLFGIHARPQFRGLTSRIVFLQGLLLVFLTSAGATFDGHTQNILNRMISIQVKNQSLKNVVDQLQSQSQIRFIYSTRIQLSESVDLEATNEPLHSVLNRLLRPFQIDYKVVNEQIVLTRQKKVTATVPEHQPMSPILPGFERPADRSIVGQITDESGQGLPGVSVVIKGTSRGTTTDAKGEFNLESPDNATLVISSVGYETVEIAVRPIINVKLVPSVNQLAEVVVAYGKQNKALVSGAVASVNLEEIRNRPTSSMQNALQGVVPGLTVLNRTADVNASGNTSIVVRGRTNLGSPGPMIIIDGVPAISTQEFTALNQNDIASISVLKDAASASLYGSRAANGVILVTTRRGSTGKSSIEFNANYGVQSATYLPRYVNSADYATLYNEALTNAGKAALYTADQIQALGNGSNPDLYPNTNWYKEVLRAAAPQADYNLNINGSGQTTRYYLGASYFNQQSLIPGKALDRYNFKINTESKLIPNLLTVSTNLSFLRNDYNRNGADLDWLQMNRSLPITVLRQSDGQWGSISGGTVNAVAVGVNQLRRIQEGGQARNKDDYFQAITNAALTPLPGLTISGLASLKINNLQGYNFVSTIAPVPNFLTKQLITSTLVTPNSMTETWQKQQGFLVQGLVDYERSFGKHLAKITVGASQESNIDRSIGVGRRNFPNNDLRTVITGSSQATDLISGQNYSSEVQWAIRSFFGRVNYAYNDKYLLEGNIRADYSSRFSPEYRKAIFPSFSAGWRLSQEDFLKTNAWINELKLRGSYGSLGNQDVVTPGNYYQLINIFSAYNFEGAAVDGAAQNAGANYATQWEKVYMTNLGLDFTLFGNKLSGTIEVYRKTTKGILLQLPVLATYALTSPYTNAGTTRNDGIEIDLNYSGSIGSDFKYTVGGNMSSIRNRIIDLGGVNNFIGDPYISQVGQKVGSLYGYIADGLFANESDVKNHAFQTNNTKPGDIIYRDLNNDNVINAADRAVIGNDVPWFNYGFNLSASYKQFDVSAILYGVSNVDIYLNNEASYPFFNGAGVKEQMKDRWTTTNPNVNAKWPRLLLSADGANNYNFGTSSFWLFNAAYLRVRNLSVGYNFSNNLIRHIGLSRLRLYVAANNPFTFLADKRLGDFDPELVSGRGANYPGIKTWSIGINAKF